jgi:L,D-transpeptidase YcbB
VLVAGLVLFFPQPRALLAAPDPVEVAETIRRATEQLRSTGRVTIAGKALRSARTLPEVYEARGFQLLWTDAANQEALLGEIAAVSGEGLNPADYHFEALRIAQERRRRLADSATAAATADLLLTDALLRLAAHFHFGKLDPATGEPRWDLPGPVRGESGATLARRIATGPAVAVQLAELRPVQPMYGRLKSALARYRVLQEEGGWAPIPAGRVLRLGVEDPRVPLLRRKLAAIGDFPGVVVDSTLFEPALDEAVRRFQARHDLAMDGVFGSATLAVLNRPVDERLDQLKANLERARWLLADVRGRFLLLDPAGSRVVLMDNSQLVIAQQAEFAPEARAAFEFRADMRYVVIHPDWVMPESLVQSQVAPLARRAPSELRERGLQVFNAAGEPIEPARADWSAPARLVVRQVPDVRSFLGLVRFSMPNQAQVFLHGAPRAGDSLPGSIRLGDTVALARALAGPPPAWTQEDLVAALAAGEPRTLPLAVAIPVVFAPWTSWVQPDGSVYFRRGYEVRDAEIIAGLLRSAEDP